MDLQDFVPKTDDLVVELKVGDKLLKNEDGSTMTITFYSPYSDEAKKIKHAMIDQRIKLAKEKDSTELTASQVEEINIESLVKNTKEWNITWGKDKPKLSDKVAKEIYRKAFWITSLYDAEVDKSLDFMKA